METSEQCFRRRPIKLPAISFRQCVKTYRKTVFIEHRVDCFWKYIKLTFVLYFSILLGVFDFFRVKLNIQRTVQNLYKCDYFKMNNFSVKHIPVRKTDIFFMTFLNHHCLCLGYDIIRAPENRIIAGWILSATPDFLKKGKKINANALNAALCFNYRSSSECCCIPCVQA